MSDKKHSSGTGKKFLGFIGALALIAIIIVVIVIAIPPDPKSALDLLNTASTTSFIKDSETQTNFKTFKEKIEANVVITRNGYLEKVPAEMADVVTISDSLASVLDFYGEYVVFMQEGTSFQQNYKDVKVSLTSAMSRQKRLNTILSEAVEIDNTATTYLQNKWIEFREEYSLWLDDYNKAVDALRVSFKGSMGNTTVNNLASTMVLDTIADYVDVLSNDFASMVEYDKENPNAITYEYDLQGKVIGFKDFVSKCLLSGFFKNYYFNSSMIKYFEKLNEYYEVYDEPDMTNAISSIKYISSKAVVTKTYEGITDEDDVYTSIKVFLVGGIL